MVRGQLANLVRMAKNKLGFLRTTESKDLGLMSQPKVVNIV